MGATEMTGKIRRAILTELRSDRFTAWSGKRLAIANAHGVHPNLITSYMAVMLDEGLIERNGTSGDLAYRLTEKGAAEAATLS